MANQPTRRAVRERVVWFTARCLVSGADCESAFDGLCERLRAPLEVRDLAVLLCRCREGIRSAQQSEAPALLALLKSADAFRRAQRFEELIAVARLAEPVSAAGVQCARAALSAALAVDAAKIARNAESTAAISAAIDAARIAAIPRGGTGEP